MIRGKNNPLLRTIYRTLLIVFFFLSSTYAYELIETGFLRNNVGQPLSIAVPMEFRIYGQPVGGIPLWDSGVITVTVNDGLYTVPLGRAPQQTIDETIISSNSNYYMEYIVDGDLFQSRELIAHQAQAILADKSISAIQAQHALTSDFAITASTLASLNISQFNNDAGYISSVGVVSASLTSMTSNMAISMNALGLMGGINVSSNGNVGMGTINPIYPLDVSGQIHAMSVTVDGVVSASAFVGDGASITSLNWANISNLPTIFSAGMIVNTANLSLTSNISISMNAKGLMGAIFVSSNGNVGMGTTDPAYLLDVSGQIHATSVTVDGVVSASAFSGNGANITSLQWANIQNVPSTVTTEIMVNTANLSLTSNIAISMNASGLMGNIALENNTIHLSGDVNVSGNLQVSGKVVFPLGNVVIVSDPFQTIVYNSSFVRIQGSDSLKDMTANPQITAGIDGEQLILVGNSDIYPIKLNQGNGLILCGGVCFTLGNNDAIRFVYSNGNWQELNRSDN